MKYPLPLEVFLPNGLSGRHPPFGGHPSRASGGGGGEGGGHWRQKFCRYSPWERVLRCGISPQVGETHFPPPYRNCTCGNRNQNIFKFKPEQNLNRGLPAP